MNRCVEKPGLTYPYVGTAPTERATSRACSQRRSRTKPQSKDRAHSGHQHVSEAVMTRAVLKLATGAIDLQTELEFLDAVFDVAARAVDFLVDELRRGLQIGDNKARVVLGFATRTISAAAVRASSSCVRRKNIRRSPLRRQKHIPCLRPHQPLPRCGKRFAQSPAIRNRSRL